MNDLKLQVKKNNLVLGIVLLIVAVLLEIMFIAIGRTEENGTILMIGGSIVIVLPIVAFGLISLISYRDNKSLMGSALELYGEAQIVNHVKQNTLKTYQEGKNTIYFTNKLVVDPQQAVFTYNAVAWVYVTDVSTRYGTNSMLTVDMLNGKSTILCSKLKKEEAQEILALFLAGNPKVLLGYNEQNKAVCEQLQAKYKNGEITVGKADLM